MHKYKPTNYLLLLEQQTKLQTELDKYLGLEKTAIKTLGSMGHSVNLEFSLRYIVDALTNSKAHNIIIIKELEMWINSRNLEDY